MKRRWSLVSPPITGDDTNGMLPGIGFNMAASMGSMRVKLSFESFLNRIPSLPRKIWLLVDLNKIKTVSELQQLILSRFNLSCQFQLYMESCLLPSWENVRIIRDNEELCVVQDSSSTCENGSDMIASVDLTEMSKQLNEGEPRKKKKKKKRKYSELEDGPVTDNISGGSTTSTLDAEVDKKNDGQKQVGEIVQYKGKMECQNSVGRSAVSEEDEPGGKRLCQTMNDKGQESSAMDLAIRKTLEAITPITTPNDELPEIQENTSQTSNQKQKRRRIRRRKKKANTEHSESFHDGSVLGSSTPVAQGAVSHKGFPLSNKPVDENVVHRVTNFGARHVKFNESEDELPVEAETAATEDITVSPAPTDNSQTSKDTEADSDKMVKQHSVSCDSDELKSKDVQPNLDTKSTAESQNPCPKPAAELARVPELIQSKTDATRSPGFKEHCVTTFQKGPFASVKVFSRKQNKKAGYVPLTKEEQLSCVATNKSFIYKNHDSNSSVTTCSGSEDKKTKQNDAAVKMSETDGVPKACNKDYSSYPELIGPPRAGDVIAYKILEMNANYCPEVSEYKEAKVLKYDPNSQDVEIEVLTVTEHGKKLGRFDVTIEDEDCIITNTEQPQTMMKIPWSSLIQPRLVT